MGPTKKGGEKWELEFQGDFFVHTARRLCLGCDWETHPARLTLRFLQIFNKALGVRRSLFTFTGTRKIFLPLSPRHVVGVSFSIFNKLSLSFKEKYYYFWLEVDQGEWKQITFCRESNILWCPWFSIGAWNCVGCSWRMNVWVHIPSRDLLDEDNNPVTISTPSLPTSASCHSLEAEYPCGSDHNTAHYFGQHSHLRRVERRGASAPHCAVGIHCKVCKSVSIEYLLLYIIQQQIGSRFMYLRLGLFIVFSLGGKI